MISIIRFQQLVKLTWRIALSQKKQFARTLQFIPLRLLSKMSLRIKCQRHLLESVLSISQQKKIPLEMKKKQRFSLSNWLLLIRWNNMEFKIFTAKKILKNDQFTANLLRSPDIIAKVST